MFSTFFLNRERGLRNGWWIAAFYLLLGLSLVAVSRVQSGTPPSEALQLLLVAGTTVVLQFLRRRPLTEIAGKPDARAMQGLALGMIGGAALMGISALFLAVGGWVQFRAGGAGATLLWSGLLAALTVGALEELVFRGFMFQRLTDGLGVWAALFLTSTYFVLTHLNNPGMQGMTAVLAGLNIFVASLMFGLALLRTGGLAMPIALHAMANFVQGSVLGFGVSGNATPGMLQPVMGGAPDWLTGGQFGLEASVPGLLAVGAMTIALYVWRGLPAASATSR